MGDLWLPGYERVPIAQRGGGTYVGGPWRGVLHTTEGPTVGAAVSAYASHGVPPHCTVDPGRNRKVQHIPLNKSAYALKHPGGTVETNRLHAIQIEIVGHAAETHNWDDSVLRWLGHEVLAPIMQAVPVAPVTVPFYGEGCGWTLASTHGRQRMPSQEWSRFSGWCGHQHVPNNDHWDPGGLNVSRILELLGHQQEGLTVGQYEEIMARLDRIEAEQKRQGEKQEHMGHDNWRFKKRLGIGDSQEEGIVNIVDELKK